MYSKYGDFHTIDWPRDLARDRLRHKCIRAYRRKDFPFGSILTIWDAGSGWICVLLVGMAAGAIAGVIDIGARWMSDLKDGICADRFWLDREHCCWAANDSAFKDNDCLNWRSWPEVFLSSGRGHRDWLYHSLDFIFFVSWAVALAGLAVTLVKTFAPYACGSGIPEIKCILSGFIIRGYLGKWTLEEASYYFPLKTMWRSFFCALVAGVVLRFVNPFGSDQTSLFHVDYSMRWTFMELIPFAALGIFGGLLGSLFIWSNIKWCAYRKNTQWLGQNPIYELFDRCGPEDYGQNLCDYNRNFTFGQVVDKVDDNYHTGDLGSGLQTAIFQLVMALFAKLLFTIFTFGVKVPSGLFVPSLAMGAIAGRLLGIKVEGLTYALQQQYPKSDLWTCRIGRDCVMPGLYAMVGAAAVLGGVTRMTVSLVVIMFELTGSLEFIVPTMAAVMFAKWVGDAIYKTGIYDAHIELNGYPFLDNKGEYPYSTVAAQVMRPSNEMRVIEQNGMSVGELETVLRESNCNGFPIVNDVNQMLVVGFCTRTLNNEQLPGSPAPLYINHIMDVAPMTVADQTPMETVIDMFRKLGLRGTLVTNNGRLLGIITKKDILTFMKEGEHN
uniref:CBS domain-containing protein n=1 Tax=Meloidogyne javanica TaxID=6303 RepID=A0A915LKV1_MELJA